jgi:hypothetical protein
MSSWPEAIFAGIALLWLSRQGLQGLIQRYIRKDQLEKALRVAPLHTYLWPFSASSWVQWGNLLGDAQHWQIAQRKFRMALRLGGRNGALLGLGTAELALAESPQQSALAHPFFQAAAQGIKLATAQLPHKLPSPLSKDALKTLGEQYHKEGWVVIDNFLSCEAVDALYQHCQHPQMWRHTYTGYDGAHLDDGLSDPLIYQLAESLATDLNAIFNPYQLMYAWAFRYHPENQGVALHHDSAQINVNLWLTPDSYNKDSHTGGLLLYPQNPPGSWDLERYTLSPEQMQGFIQTPRREPVQIPYRQGRLVIFNSRFLHQTQSFSFQDQPHQRRLNLTLLFGKYPLRYHPRHILPKALYKTGVQNRN